MTDSIISTAIAVSIVILVVLGVRGAVARHFGPQAAYALWLAPLARALWPLVPTISRSETAAAPSGTAPEIVITRLPSVADHSVMPWVLGLWAAGGAIYLAYQLTQHHRFLRRALSRGTALAPRGIAYDVIASDAVAGPVATGLLHPIILVPADFGERFTPDQQRLALLHEELHHRRGDIWASAAALLLTAALWFNPLVHLALGAFRRDMEAACDSSVLARATPVEATTYAETILRCASRPVPRSLCALTSIEELKGRLTMLTLNHGRGQRLAGFTFAAALSGVGLAISVPAAAADEPKTKKEIVHRVIIDGDEDAADSKHREHADISVSNCPGEKFEAQSSAGGSDKKETARIVLCTKGGVSSADRADSMARALDRLNSDSEMDSAVKAELKSKLEAKIAELRAGK